MADETEALGSDWTEATNQLSQHTTQIGGGFYQLIKDSDYEDRYPNAINDFVETEGFKKIAAKAEVTTNELKPPLSISDDVINDIQNIFDSADPLNMTDEELTSLRADVSTIINGLSLPTIETINSFISAYTKFVAAASTENAPFPTNFREIQLVSTDTSIDSFLARTGIRKLVAIQSNNLVYPFITERFRVPSQLQATVTGATGSEGETTIPYLTLNKEIGVTSIKVGSILLITNNAKELEDLIQQKVSIDYISETDQIIRLSSGLLFDLDSTFVVEIYQYTKDQVLSPGDLIKIPQ